MYIFEQRSPSNLGAYLPGRSAANLGAYRPNWAVKRGFISGLGDVTTDLTSGTAVNLPLLLGGVALFGAAVFLLGGKALPAMRQKRASRLRSRRAALSKKISLLEA